MNWATVGDAMQHFRLRSDGNMLKDHLNRLATELSTGRVSDVGKATGGNYTALASISHGLKLAETFKTTISEATIDANIRQATLEKVETEISGFAPMIMEFSLGGAFSDMMLAIGDAGDRFDHAVAALNTNIGGRTLFSGDAPDQLALISAEEMLAELRPLVAGAADANAMMVIVEDWFMATGGGYETVAWQGGSGDAAPVVLSEGVTEDAAVSALDPSIREVLSGLALASLVSEGSGPLAEEDRRAAAIGAAEWMQSGESALIILRSDLGISQARIESARVEMEATRVSLELEKSRLTEADPYETATDLEAVEARLESLYLVTARLSRLNLSEYIR